MLQQIIDRIVPFNNREVDPTKQVEVYRCLNKGGTKASPLYSVRQNGLVVGHTRDLTLTACEIKISEAGRLRCKTSGQKNVHAYIRGFITNNYDTDKVFPVTYNPYTNASFIFKNNGLPVPSSVQLARVNAQGAHVRCWS